MISKFWLLQSPFNRKINILKKGNILDKISFSYAQLGAAMHSTSIVPKSFFRTEFCVTYIFIYIYIYVYIGIYIYIIYKRVLRTKQSKKVTSLVISKQRKFFCIFSRYFKAEIPFVYSLRVLPEWTKNPCFNRLKQLLM